MYLKDSSVALHHSILTENIQQTTKPESAEEQTPSGWLDCFYRFLRAQSQFSPQAAV